MRNLVHEFHFILAKSVYLTKRAWSLSVIPATSCQTNVMPKRNFIPSPVNHINKHPFFGHWDGTFGPLIPATHPLYNSKHYTLTIQVDTWQQREKRAHYAEIRSQQSLSNLRDLRACFMCLEMSETFPYQRPCESSSSRQSTSQASSLSQTSTCRFRI